VIVESEGAILYFGFLRTIECLERGAGTVLEMRELVDVAVRRVECWVVLESRPIGGNHSLFTLEERFSLEVFKGKSPADRNVQQL
jgi:hypothetical protein